MSATTPFLNLYKPGGGSTGLITPDEVADIDRLNTNFDSIDTWAQTTDTFRLAQLANNQQYRGLTANIGSVASPRKGDTYQETDALLRKFEYDGANWVTQEAGMYLIKPSTFAGCTIAADGSIIPTATPTEITLDNVFTTRFRSYKIIFQIRNSGAGIGLLINLRRGGANVGGATGYGYSRINGSTAGAIAGSASVGAAAWDLVSSGGAYVAGELTLHNPAFTGLKTMVGHTIGVAAGNTTSSFGGANGDATILAALDGIKFAPTSGTFLIDSSQSFIKLYGLT